MARPIIRRCVPDASQRALSPAAPIGASLRVDRRWIVSFAPGESPPETPPPSPLPLAGEGSQKEKCAEIVSKCATFPVENEWIHQGCMPLMHERTSTGRRTSNLERLESWHEARKESVDRYLGDRASLVDTNQIGLHTRDVFAAIGIDYAFFMLVRTTFQ